MLKAGNPRVLFGKIAMGRRHIAIGKISPRVPTQEGRYLIILNLFGSAYFFAYEARPVYILQKCVSKSYFLSESLIKIYAL